MFPLSLLALKYSYFRRGRKKSVTAADRGEVVEEEEDEGGLGGLVGGKT